MTAPACLNAALFRRKPDLIKTYVSNKLDGANATVYTYTAMAIGSEPWIVLGAYYKDSTSGVSISGITVGGVAATLINEHPTEKHSFWRVPHPGGTTADVIVTLPAAGTLGVLGLWNLSAAPDSWAPYDTLYLASGSGTLDVPAGGVAFGIGKDDSSAGDTWTAGLISDFTGQTGADVASGSGASMSSATLQVGMTVTTDVDKAYIISLGP
jgi:hypothetical protein